jgi:hypothetical protein
MQSSSPGTRRDSTTATVSCSEYYRRIVPDRSFRSDQGHLLLFTRDDRVKDLAVLRRIERTKRRSVIMLLDYLFVSIGRQFHVFGGDTRLEILEKLTVEEPRAVRSSPSGYFHLRVFSEKDKKDLMQIDSPTSGVNRVEKCDSARDSIPPAIKTIS